LGASLCGLILVCGEVCVFQGGYEILGGFLWWICGAFVVGCVADVVLERTYLWWEKM
jgi:hypothetical protein